MKPLCPQKICGRTSKVLISITTISISWAMGGGSPPAGLPSRGHLVKIVDCWRGYVVLFIWFRWIVLWRVLMLMRLCCLVGCFLTCAHSQKRIDQICPKQLRPRVRPARSYDLDLCRLEPPVQDRSGTFWSRFGEEQRLTDYRGRQECRLAQVHWFLWYPICNTYHWYNFWMVKL